MENFDEFYAEAKRSAKEKGDLLARLLMSQHRTEDLMKAADDPRLLDRLYEEFKIS